MVLYPIVDVDSLKALKLDALEFARQVLEASPQWLQLRAKHLSARETLELLRALRSFCAAMATSPYSPTIVLTWHSSAAVTESTSVRTTSRYRTFAESRPGCASAFRPTICAQLRVALEEQPDYVAFGPIFATRSKERPDPVVGLDGLGRALELARAASIPIVAIGGISSEQRRQTGSLEICGAVIGAILPADGDVDGVARIAIRLQAALKGQA